MVTLMTLEVLRTLMDLVTKEWWGQTWSPLSDSKRLNCATPMELAKSSHQAENLWKRRNMPIESQMLLKGSVMIQAELQMSDP